jgi:hypothetical protein
MEADEKEKLLAATKRHTKEPVSKPRRNKGFFRLFSRGKRHGKRH